MSRLRKENQSLTNAFLWLCSGNADWQTLVRTLPQNLCGQLPSTVPLLLTGSQSASDSSASGSASDGRKPVDTEQIAPSTPEPPLTPRFPPRAEPSRRRNRSLCHKRWSHCPSRPGSDRSASRHAGRPPFSQCNKRNEGLAHRFLEQFPELAALESEFQDLVSRPATA